MVVGGRASQADASDDRHRGIVANVPERPLDGQPLAREEAPRELALGLTVLAADGCGWPPPDPVWVESPAG